jgi:hypothetical protein
VFRLILIDGEDPWHTRYMLGRRSFGDFNPTITKMNREAMGDSRGAEQQRGAITDREMAQRYDKFIGLRGKSVDAYAKRRGRPAKKGQAIGENIGGSNKKQRKGGGGGRKRSNPEPAKGGEISKKPRPFIKPKQTL